MMILLSSYQPKIKSDTCPSTPLLLAGDVVLFAGVPAGLGASGVEGLGGAPAFLKADVEGASLMGVPTLGVFEGKGDCIGSSTTIAGPEGPFSATGPEVLDRSND
jgi:hypothetical protein